MCCDVTRDREAQQTQYAPVPTDDAMQMQALDAEAIEVLDGPPLRGKAASKESAF